MVEQKRCGEMDEVKMGGRWAELPQSLLLLGKGLGNSTLGPVRQVHPDSDSLVTGPGKVAASGGEMLRLGV